jgi:hypothetical protein
VAEAKARYSASDEDLETVNCFLDFQQTRDWPMKKQKPVIDLLVSGQPPQSASLNPDSCKEEFLGKNKPVPGLPLRYLKTLCAALKCSDVGASRN